MGQGIILVTGGAGFIGSNIVADLADSGQRVAVSDHLGCDDKWHNLAKHELEDLIAPDRLFDWLGAHGDDVEAILHMGAISSTTERDADLIVDSNFRLSVRLWDWCAAHGKRLIYASSAATYGDGAQGFDDDSATQALATLRPLNPYGWSKHLFDRWVMRRTILGAPAPAQWVGLKFFNVYGPNEGHKGDLMSVLAKAFASIKAGEPVRLFRSHHPDYADGGQLRDFVYVGDCVAAVRWLLDQREVNGIFNIGTGQARSFKDLALAVYDAMGVEPNIQYISISRKLPWIGCVVRDLPRPRPALKTVSATTCRVS